MSKVVLGSTCVYIHGCAAPPAAALLRIGVESGRLSMGEERCEPLIRETTIQVAADRIDIRTSAMNVTPVYFAAIPRRMRFVVGTDFPATAAGLAALTGESPQLHADAGLRLRSGTAVEGVERLPYGTELTLRHESEGWVSRVRRDADVLHVARPVIEEPLAAGLAQIGVLRDAIVDVAAGRCRASVLVSGGVDSGLVTALAREVGLEITPFSVGTQWGDEFDNARELTDALGLELRTVTLTTDDVMAALPATIRALGHAEPEVVDIGVALSAFFEQHRATDRLLLTGYGSDLLNSGMATGGGIHPNIQSRILAAVHRARCSAEFSGSIAREHGYTLAHPYWNHHVIDVALRTSPSAKAAGKREKGHLRMAAETLLPETVAWRQKTAIHHGNGVSANIGQRIDADTGLSGGRPSMYRAILGELLAATCAHPGRSVSGSALYERAVTAVAQRSTNLRRV